MLKLPLIAVMLLVDATLVSATDVAPVKFSKPPTAAKAGDAVKIEFAVSCETDVAVFIEDAGGKVVRHLVAGVLGKNPPPPARRP